MMRSAFWILETRWVLSRVGHVEDYVMHPIIGMEKPYYYRNKAQFPVGLGKDGQIVTGFYAGHSHVIVDSAHCCIQLFTGTIFTKCGSSASVCPFTTVTEAPRSIAAFARANPIFPVE